MNANTTDLLCPSKAIRQLVIEARDNEKQERRAEPRYPLFRPVSMQIDGRRFSAFSREISATGIGLLHNFEIIPGEIELSIAGEDGLDCTVATRMVWCRPCGEGWYLSGGKFLNVTA